MRAVGRGGFEDVVGDFGVAAGLDAEEGAHEVGPLSFDFEAFSVGVEAEYDSDEDVWVRTGYQSSSGHACR